MKLYQAAWESAYCGQDLLPSPDTNVFLSYFYKSATDKFLKDINKTNGYRGLITIDSGAHSFFAGTTVDIGFAGIKKKEEKELDPAIYFSQYLNWAESNYDKIDYFVELDLQELVGKDLVNSWRTEIIRRKLGPKCIFVHHQCDNFDDFKRMVDISESKYIGIEGFRSNRPELSYDIFIKYCYKNNCKIHCFAMIKMQQILKYPFYSVDSSSWKGCVRYGALYYYDFKRGRLGSFQNSANNFLKYKIDLNYLSSSRSKESSHAKLGFCSNTYMELEKEITNLWIKRGIIWEE